MNLSCANCKAIRNFSGDPPKCDVCGWTVNAAPKYGLKQGIENLARGLVKAVGYLFLVLIGGYIFYQFFLPDRIKIANEYNLPESQVFVETKPHGCDFEDAPLGNKHCHYEKEVMPQRSCDRPDCPVTSVYVSWRKVEE